MERASIYLRFIGLVADGLVFSFVSTILFYVLGPQLSSTLWTNIIFLLLTYLYFVLLPLKLDGKTLGKILARTKVVSEKGSLTIKQLAIRYASLYGFFFVLQLTIFLGNTFSNITTVIIVIALIVYMIRDPQNRGPHDMIAGTKVIKSK